MLLELVKELLKTKNVYAHDQVSCYFCHSIEHEEDCVWERLKKEVIVEEHKLQEAKKHSEYVHQTVSSYLATTKQKPLELTGGTLKDWPEQLKTTDKHDTDNDWGW